jgi:hypothetical protein
VKAPQQKISTFENALSLCLQRSGTKLAALGGLFVKCRRCKKVFKRTNFLLLGFRKTDRDEKHLFHVAGDSQDG